MRVLYYDTETTGIDPRSHRIVEIAIYEPASEKTFVRLVNPGCLIPAEATAIHHIDDAMVANEPTFSEMAEQVIEFCQGDVVLIAHNNDSFDVRFLRYEFQRCGMELPEHWQFIDTLKWARRYRPDLPEHNLQFLRKMYNVPANKAHRALDDVITLHQVFSQMIDDLPIEKVLELLSRRTAVLRMPFGKHRGQPLIQVPANYLAWLEGSGALDKPENQDLRSSLETLGLLTSKFSNEVVC